MNRPQLLTMLTVCIFTFELIKARRKPLVFYGLCLPGGQCGQRVGKFASRFDFKRGIIDYVRD